MLLLCLAAAGWSGNFVVGRLIHGTTPPVGLAFFRWLAATAVILPFGLPKLRRDLPVLLRHKGTVLLLAATGVAAYNTFIYQGLQSTTAISALLMQSIMPLLILVFVFALYRERPRAPQLLGLALSLAAGSIAAVAYVALVPSLLCYFCYNRGAELLGAARAGQFLHLMPVFGAVLAFVFLDERIRVFHLVGAAFIGAGLAAAAMRRSRLSPPGRSHPARPGRPASRRP